MKLDRIMLAKAVVFWLFALVVLIWAALEYRKQTGQWPIP